VSRVVLVTGGTKGLGRGLAQAFTDAGDQVVVCGRNPGDGPGRFVACDVRDPAAVDALIEDVMAHEGRLDVVVNNAGGSPSALVSEASPRLAERVVALNLLAPLYVARAARAVMTSGVVVNIGSVAAVRPAPGTAAYAAAKAGLAVLTRALALEWAPDVRVNQVTVGLLDTERTSDTYGEDAAPVAATVPMGRLATPADVAAAVLALCSPTMAYVTGADLFVDGGGEVPAFHAALSKETYG
jgi:NAD(P)-dependent dehydrogenase (short-subunit alcohol dehydrogenase family)